MKCVKFGLSHVCGPKEVDSLGDNRYFVTFINDLSKKVWLYLLKSKDEEFHIFQQFYVMIKRERWKSS